MLKVKLVDHDYKYEVAELVKLFTRDFCFKNEETDKKENSFEILKNNLKIIEKDNGKIKTIVSKTEYIKDNKIIAFGEESTLVEKKENESDKAFFYRCQKLTKRMIKRSIYIVLKKEFDNYTPWGVLTGIRPVKIVHALFEEGMSEDDIYNIFRNDYLVDDEKTKLVIEIAKREQKYIYPLSKEKISLYVSVPFCPTRCVYCSFPSNSLQQFGHLRDDYVEAVLKEAKGVQNIIKEYNKEIETLYIGGGTPSALEAKQMDRLISGLFEILDLSKIKEFTVEAGRVDTIDREKLEIIKKYGANRISINPQTMNDVTLRKIGRKHTAKDIEDCMKMAREIGFDNINMDVILGLFGEDVEMVENTMKQLEKINPESLTVHTLAIKRASDLNINMDEYKNELTQHNEMIKMIEVSKKYAEKMNLNPYYMYRQKHMLGNLENVGYSKEGYECLYNMQIMEEMQSNYAIGAGAVSKFIYLDENRIERVDDVKNLEIYLDRVDDMINKKYKEVKKNVN